MISLRQHQFQTLLRELCQRHSCRIVRAVRTTSGLFFVHLDQNSDKIRSKTKVFETLAGRLLNKDFKNSAIIGQSLEKCL